VTDNQIRRHDALTLSRAGYRVIRGRGKREQHPALAQRCIESDDARVCYDHT